MNPIAETVERHLVFTGPLPLWAVIVLAGGALAAAVWLLRRELGHRARRPRTRLLFGLRGLAVLLLALLIAQPVLFTRHERRRPAPVLVIPDTSGSMLRRDAWTDGELLGLAAILGVPGLDARNTLSERFNETLYKHEQELRQARDAWRDVHDQLAQGLPWGQPYQVRLDNLRAALSELTGTLQALGEDLAGFEHQLRQDDTKGLPAYAPEPFAAIVVLRDHAGQANAAAAALATLPEATAVFALWQQTNDVLADIEAARPLWSACQQRADEAFLAVLPAVTRGHLDELGQTSRFDLAHRLIERLADGDNAHLLEWQGPTSLDATHAASQTDLYGLLEGAARTEVDENVSGVLLLSDGGQNLPPRPAILGRLRHRPIPVLTVGVGSSQSLTDAAILDYRLPRVLPARERVTAHVRLKTAVPAKTPLRLQLRAGEEILADRALPADGKPVQDVDLELRTPTESPEPWILSVKTPETDDVPGNDAVRFAVSLRERDARVLLVALEPRWDLVYLLRQLGNLPCRIDTVYWGETKPGQEVRRGSGRGKIPATVEDFARYDLVILDGRPFPTIGPEDGQAIAGYVAGGGTLVLTADATGESYVDALALFPPTSGEARQAPLLPTPGARLNPAVAVDADVTRSLSIWRSLPPVRYARAVPAADTVLLSIDNMPTLAVACRARGRVYTLGCGELYALREWQHGAVVDRFLEALLADCLQDRPEAGPFLYPGQPVAGAPLWVFAEATAGEGSWQGQDGPSRPLRFGGPAGGTVRAQVDAVPAGRLTVTAPDGSSRTVAVVEPLSSEDIYLDLDVAALERIAAGAGGDYVALADLPARLRQLPQRTARDVTLTERRLWHLPLMLLLIVGILTVDWVVRRQEGLVL